MDLRDGDGMKLALSVEAMRVGGIPTFILNLSQRLRQAGHEVLVIAQQQGEWWPRLAERGVHGYCLPRRQWDSVQQAAQRFATYVTAQQVDLLLVNIDIGNRLPLLALHLLADAMPVVLVLHNDRPEVYELAALNAAAWNCAIGVSPKVQQMAATRFAQKPVVYIPNGTAIPVTVAQDERHGWTTPLRLLFVGRLVDQQKGIFRLPAMLAECRKRQLPVHLTVMGEGPDGEQLDKLFQEVGVSDQVTFCGRQPHEAVLAAMRTEHILLLPSNYEGLPLVLLEAQANGCVPIAARLPGITDVALQDGVSGVLVEPTDINGFVAAISHLRNATVWQHYSQAGIDHAQQHFSIQRMGERYTTLFSALAQGAYPLPSPRANLRRQGLIPLSRRDALPQPVRRALQRILKRVK